MTSESTLRLQLAVFALAAASFTNIYLPQPVLPVLQEEFASDTLTVSYTIAAVILGIALSILPFGALSDRISIHPIILTGGLVVAAAGLLCSLT
ncbi:MAG: MFS transporter, partial [Pseudomonadota bacterium]